MSTSNVPADSLSSPNATQLDSQPRRPVGWGFWLQWTLVTGVGWIVGLIIFRVILKNLPFDFLTLTTSTMFVGIIFALPIAASFGLMQSLILKKYGFPTLRFIRASALGGALGGVLSELSLAVLFCASRWATSIAFLLWLTTAGAITGAITGAVVGFFQEDVLAQGVLSEFNWVRASTMAWAVACAVLGVLLALWSEGSLDGDSLIFDVLPFATCGLSGGAITGIPLVRMLRQFPTSNLQSPVSSLKL